MNGWTTGELESLAQALNADQGLTSGLIAGGRRGKSRTAGAQFQASFTATCSMCTELLEQVILTSSQGSGMLKRGSSKGEAV